MAKEESNQSLSKEQKFVIALLAIGMLFETFDSYFSLDVGAVIDPIFFPTNDTKVKETLDTFSYSASYSLCPIGALIAGYIGDVFGRRVAFISTAALVSFCSLVQAFLPTYKDIGYMAFVILTICRMLQSMSIVAVRTGIDIYISENISPPLSCVATGVVYSLAAVGAILSSTSAAFFSSKTVQTHFPGEYWRVAYILGAIAGIASIQARFSLRDAYVAVDKKQILKKQFKAANIPFLKANKSINPDVPFATIISYFFINCVHGVFYVEIYFNNLLEKSFGFSEHQVTLNKISTCTLSFCMIFFTALAAQKMAPLKILRLRLFAFYLLVPPFILFLNFHLSAKTIIIFQHVLTICYFWHSPANPIFLKHFPALVRFRYAAVIASCAATCSGILGSWACTFFANKFGQLGILITVLPFGICYTFGLNYFQRKEKETKTFLAKQFI